MSAVKAQVGDIGKIWISQVDKIYDIFCISLDLVFDLVIYSCSVVIV